MTVKSGPEDSWGKPVSPSSDKLHFKFSLSDGGTGSLFFRPEWKPLIGPDPLRYCALIGLGNGVATPWTTSSMHSKPSFLHKNASQAMSTNQSTVSRGISSNESSPLWLPHRKSTMDTTGVFSPSSGSVNYFIEACRGKGCNVIFQMDQEEDDEYYDPYYDGAWAF